MSSFATLLVRADGHWRGTEIDLAGCESLTDIADLALDESGDVRLILIEEDDEYAAIVRVDTDDADPRAFLSDGHAADNYALAAVIADDLVEVLADELDDDDELGDAPPAHESVPFGDADVVEDLGPSAAELVEMCSREGTLPIDVLVWLCERAGCADAFDTLRA